MLCKITGLVLMLQLVQSAMCFVHLSFNKTADMSSSQYSDKWLADEAVDGNITQKVTQNSCAVTSDNFHKQAWWRVDLGDVHILNSVKIYYRKESEDQSLTYWLSGFSIYVADTLNWWIGTRCYLHNNGERGPGPSDILTVPCNATGRYVTVYLQRNGSCAWSQHPQHKVYCAKLELCEVQIQSCENGTYGESCTHNCSDNCLYGVHCNKAHGGCDDGCVPGYRGFYCNEECNDGVFGYKCSNPCGKCKNDECDHKTGMCASGCAPGWKGNYCNETCQHGTYGENCNYNCSDKCRDITKCRATDGYCEMCFEGWMGHFCDKECKAGAFGSNCSSVCGHCKGVTCNHINGSCPADCLPGWKGIYCNETCNHGFYGNRCLYMCKSCAVTCHHITGRCLVYDKQTTDGDTDDAMVAVTVTCVAFIIGFAVALLITCLQLRRLTSPNVTNVTHAINHGQGRVQLSDMNVNPYDAVNERNPKPAMQGSSSVTYEDLVMPAPSDSNTYESLQQGREVTYTNTELF